MSLEKRARESNMEGKEERLECEKTLNFLFYRHGRNVIFHFKVSYVVHVRFWYLLILGLPEPNMNFNRQKKFLSIRVGKIVILTHN